MKVLDFGLARIVEADNSPTLTFAATQMGMILGTAAYMSPEQARGRPADKRSDIWAVGCVLFEMLAGKRPFDGEDVSDTLAAVLRSDPGWRLPANVPTALRDVIRGCLEKDPKTRVRDLSVVQYVLSRPAMSDGPLEGPLTTRAAMGGKSAPRRADGWHRSDGRSSHSLRAVAPPPLQLGRCASQFPPAWANPSG